MKAVRVVGMAASQPAEGTSDYASGRLYEQTRNGISLALDTDSPQTRTAMTCAVHAITMISMMKMLESTSCWSSREATHDDVNFDYYAPIQNDRSNSRISVSLARLNSYTRRILRTRLF